METTRERERDEINRQREEVGVLMLIMVTMTVRLEDVQTNLWTFIIRRLKEMTMIYFYSSNSYDNNENKATALKRNAFLYSGKFLILS